MQERQLRRRTFLGGHIIFNGGGSTIDCTIKDFSEGGAKLAVQNGLMPPERFDLQLNDGRTFTCEIRWRRMDFIGVAFV